MEEKSLEIIEDKIDFIQIILDLWNKKSFIIKFSLSLSLVFFLYSFLLPTLYQSKAILKINETSDRSFSSDSSLFGSIPFVLNQDTKSFVEIEVTIESTDFLETLHGDDNFVLNLCCVDSYSSSLNKTIFNEDIYNISQSKWVQDNNLSLKPSVTSMKGFLKSKNFEIQSLQGDYFEIKYKNRSPLSAKDTIDTLVSQANRYLRDTKREELILQIENLKSLIRPAENQVVKNALSNSIQSKLTQLSLLNVKDDYIMSYVESPRILKTKTSPIRLNFIILGFFFGLILSVIYIVLLIPFQKLIKEKS